LEVPVPTHTAASLAWDCTTPPEPQQNNSNTWEFLLLHKNCPHLIPRPLALIKSINQPKNTTSRWHPQGNSSQSGAQSGYMSKHNRTTDRILRGREWKRTHTALTAQQEYTVLFNKE
jgi:hypothetical protein